MAEPTVHTVVNLPEAIVTEEVPAVQRDLGKALTERILQEDHQHMRDLIHPQAEVRDIEDLPEPTIREVRPTEVQAIEVRAGAQDIEVLAEVRQEVPVTGVPEELPEVRAVLEVLAADRSDLQEADVLVEVDDLAVAEEEDNNCII
ncbi:MAG: hypothetical protein ACR2MM_06550 [Flavobacteriaceae bacterium]